MKKDFIPYICPQCGGKVNRVTLICEMCGTAFKEEYSSRIVIEQPGIHVLTAITPVDDYALRALGLERASEECIKKLAHSFAEGIAPFMKIETRREWWDNNIKMQGFLKVADFGKYEI